MEPLQVVALATIAMQVVGLAIVVALVRPRSTLPGSFVRKVALVTLVILLALASLAVVAPAVVAPAVVATWGVWKTAVVARLILLH